MSRVSVAGVDVRRFQNCDAYDVQGVRLGPVVGLWVADDDVPQFAAVVLGSKEEERHVVPLAGSTLDGDRLMLRFSQQHIRDAPPLPTSFAPTAEQAKRIYEHYRRQDPEPFHGSTSTFVGLLPGSAGASANPG